MDEIPRLLLMLVLAGAALTLLGALAVRFNDEARRVRRGLKTVLGADPHALIVARGRGRGAGFDFGTGRMAVAWDAGAWCLIYRIDEMVGAELVVDGQVAARAHRGETRRALDVMGGADKEVRLRLLFDDARHPDFDLVLWVEADGARRGARAAEDAVQEANRWIARTEALLRRPAPRREPPPVVAQAAGQDPEDDEPPQEFDGDPPPWENDGDAPQREERTP